MTVKIITYKEFLDLEFENRGKLILPHTDYPDDTLGIIKDSCFTPIELSEKVKAEGRLVVLPCKIGDEVWFLEKQLDIANGTCSTVISEYIVTEIRGNKYNPLWYMASSERCTHRDFHPTELGKTVFLTREAAEKALSPICNTTKLPCAECNPVCEHRAKS